MEILINILYWDSGDKQRLANTNLSWFMLNKFSTFCQERGLMVRPFIFDFSEEKVIDDAIHIPYPKGLYKRSEKINEVIKYHGEKEALFAVMDSDLILKEDEYARYFSYIRTMMKNPDSYYVFNLDDIFVLDGVDFEKQTLDYTKLKTIQRNMNPDLGALFFLNIKIFNNIGGFDERFIVWGGEDNEMAMRLNKHGYQKVIIPLKPLHLPHKHALSEKDVEQYKKQVKMLGL